MNKFLLRWIINGIALYIAINLLPGLSLVNESAAAYVWIALIFGLLNASVRPLLKLLTCPLILLTLGLFTLVVNTAMFYLTEWVGDFFNLGLEINTFLAAFWGGVIVSIVSVLLTFVLRNEMNNKLR
ncbi:MAG: phage holin family protein [Chloroflexi bacterium]|nr:phage holin family protein [Chloroflexota bacterium]